MTIKISKALADAQIEWYARRIEEYTQKIVNAERPFDFLKHNIPTEVKMKTRMVLYEVSNGFMAVVDEDHENGTVVGKSIPEVLKEAESLMVTRALERENDPRVWPDNTGAKQTPLMAFDTPGGGKMRIYKG